MPKISAKLKQGHPNGGAKCRWGRLNAGAVAANWRLSTRSAVNLIRSQVYHTERPYCVCSTFAVMQGVARVSQRQLILVKFWGYHPINGTDEDRQLKFVVQTDCGEY